MAVVIILLHFVAQSHGKAREWNCNQNTQDFLDTLVDKVVEAVESRTLMVRPHLAALGNITFWKLNGLDLFKRSTYKQRLSCSPGCTSSMALIRSGQRRYRKICKMFIHPKGASANIFPQRYTCKVNHGMLQSSNWTKKALVLLVIATNIAVPLIGWTGWGIVALFSFLHISGLVTIGAAIASAGTVIGPLAHFVTLPWLGWLVSTDSEIRNFLVKHVLATLPSRLRSKLMLAMEKHRGVNHPRWYAPLTEKNQHARASIFLSRNRRSMRLQRIHDQRDENWDRQCKSLLRRVLGSKNLKQRNENTCASMAFLRGRASARQRSIQKQHDVQWGRPCEGPYCRTLDSRTMQAHMSSSRIYRPNAVSQLFGSGKAAVLHVSNPLGAVARIATTRPMLGRGAGEAESTKFKLDVHRPGMPSQLLCDRAGTAQHLLGPQGQHSAAPIRKRKRADDKALAATKRKAVQIAVWWDRALGQAHTVVGFPVPRMEAKSTAARLRILMAQVRARGRAIISEHFSSAL